VAPRRTSRTLLCRLSCWDISRGATLADSFLLVCLRIQFQESGINPNLIYQLIHVSSDCGSLSSTFRPFQRRCLCTLMFMVSIIGVLCIAKSLSIAYKIERPEFVIVHLLSFLPLLYSDVVPFSLNPFSTYRKLTR
jgi:hypothetical protein